MKNIFIQKILNNKKASIKDCWYLLTINKGARLEGAEILKKKELLKWLNGKL